jgi:hypothetical protein
MDFYNSWTNINFSFRFVFVHFPSEDLESENRTSALLCFLIAKSTVWELGQ